MIRNIADLLEAILGELTEGAKAETTVKHPGLIGEMYEGITSRILEFAVDFEKLDLHVASGLIIDGSGGISKQVDCMVCVGLGRRIPETNKRIYHNDDVIMIVEVKKRLLGGEMRKSLLWFRHHWKKIERNTTLRLPDLVRTSWQLLLRKTWPIEGEMEGYSDMEDTVFRRIVTEARMPARVVFGFDGYKNEKELRIGLFNALNKIGFIPPKTCLGADINAFPNLIVCGKACLVKLDGFPYRGVFSDVQQSWCWYGSKTGNTLLTLLEILWTRLQSRFDHFPDLFGDDLENEGMNRFGSARIVQHDGKAQWQYLFEQMHPKEIAQQEFMAWKPAELTTAEFSVLQVLCSGSTVNLDDDAVHHILRSNKVSEDELVQGLRSKELAGLRGRHVELLTEQLQCLKLADGRMVAADNNSGRLTAYVAALIRKHKLGSEMGQ